LDETSEKVAIQKILNNQNSATSNLGELIKEELEQKAERET